MLISCAGIQALFEDRLIGYALTDRNLCVIQIGGALGVFYGSADAWVGHSLLDLVPELSGSEDALLRILSGSLPRLQIPWINQEGVDGETTYVVMVELPYRDATGEIRGVIHLVQDVTELGQLEQYLAQQQNDQRLLEKTLRDQNVQLLATNAELRRLDAVKSDFVSIAAHELRTPLASIAGYVEMLLDGDAGCLNDQQMEYLGTIDQSSQRLLRITRDLLDVAKLESGRLELVLQPTDLRELLESIVADQMALLHSKSQAIQLRTAHHLPLALVDPQRTAQIVGNLIGNASKFAPPSSVICVDVAEDCQDQGFLQVTVLNQGDGIPVEDQGRLFRPFARGIGAAADGAPGTGLGLYIARLLVELHGGRIGYDSGCSAGTAFYATFPVAATS